MFHARERLLVAAERHERRALEFEEVLLGDTRGRADFAAAQHPREAVTEHSRLPIRKKIGVGNSYVGLLIDLVRNKKGEPIGYVLDMKNQTFQMMSETVLKAIDGQQIRVEMELDGSIHAVNDICCEALSMPEDRVLRLSGPNLIRLDDDVDEGVDIWKAAREGRGTPGRFQVSAGGEVRIFEGSFSPIPDQDGHPKGFLLIGSDVTEARATLAADARRRSEAASELARVVQALSQSLERLSEGDLTVRIPDAFAPD